MRERGGERMRIAKEAGNIIYIKYIHVSKYRRLCNGIILLSCTVVLVIMKFLLEWRNYADSVCTSNSLLK